MTEIKEMIKRAYEIAHDHNKNGHNTQYTYNEAIQYDPLISTLYQILRKFDQ